MLYPNPNTIFRIKYQGRIADTIDLLPGQIREIQDQLGRYLTAKRSLASAASRRNSGSNGSANSFDSPQGSSSGSFSPETSTSGSYYLTPVSPGQVPNSGGTPSQPQELSNLAHPSMPGSCGGSVSILMLILKINQGLASIHSNSGLNKIRICIKKKNSGNRTRDNILEYEYR